MKKSALINVEMSCLVAKLGHTDEVTVCDAGLPIPDETQRIDLALIPGVPTFIQTAKALLGEMQIEGVVLAEEFKQVSPEHYAALIQLIRKEEELCGKQINIANVSHEVFKVRTQNSKAVIRTGECSPYANAIFQAGIAF